MVSSFVLQNILIMLKCRTTQTDFNLAVARNTHAGRMLLVGF